MSVIPAVLLNALREYSFVGSPLWRMSDRKDLVRVELIFHKNLQTPRFYKKGGVSRRQPAPSAGEGQPAAATTPTTRSTPALRRHHRPDTADINPSTIRHQRKPQTAEITPSPIIMRPTRPPPSPDSPPSKKQRTKPPKYTRQPKEYFHVDIENEYPLHEKYDLQDI